MPADHTAQLYTAMRDWIADGAAIQTMVGNRVYDQVPAKVKLPLIRMGMPTSLAFEASCWSGSEIRLLVHCFAGPKKANCAALAAAVVQRVQEFESMPGLGIVDLQWITTEYRPEEKDWHGMVQFDVTTAQEE